ncbi:MAG: methyltransferase domain-containing protein [bacterium]
MIKRSALFKGILSYLPLSQKFMQIHTGGSVSARYCYAVWLRHLSYSYRNGLSTNPKTVMELGPGDSLGAGLAAILTGSEHLIAIDIKKYATLDNNMLVLNKLIHLFSNRTKIPDNNEFPRLMLELKKYDFPSQFLSDERLTKALHHRRIANIKTAFKKINHYEFNTIMLNYYTDWLNVQIIKKNSVDMIFSQAVLEHIKNPAQMYHKMYRWLKPGGYISHHIDFKCHRIGSRWNEHWAIPDFKWTVVKGRRKFFLNRWPYSYHCNALIENGFNIVCSIKYKRPSNIRRYELSRQYQHLSDDDLKTSEAFIQAIKE